jgi:S1-C subfamily serine protease
MTGPGEVTVKAPRRRAWSPQQGRILLAVIVAAALIGTATVAFRLGGGGRPGEAVSARPSASPKGSGQLSVAQIYKDVAASLVFIKANGDKESKASIGTGLVVNADGTILTAHHVVRNASTIDVTFADGTTSAATVAAADPASDIAILTPQQLPSVVVPAVLGSGASVGDEVVAIGNQLSLVGTTTSGVVSGLDRSIAREEGGELKGLIQFDAAVNPGSSGGPLLNARGQTIGIVVALANPTDAGTFIGVGFAVPIGTAVGGGRPPQL